jgi:hypothetical protein
MALLATTNATPPTAAALKIGGNSRRTMTRSASHPARNPAPPAIDPGTSAANNALLGKLTARLTTVRLMTRKRTLFSTNLITASAVTCVTTGDSVGPFAKTSNATPDTVAATHDNHA